MATKPLRERLATVLCLAFALLVAVVAIRDGSLHSFSGALKAVGVLVLVLSFGASPEIFFWRHDSDAEVPRPLLLGVLVFAAAFVVASVVNFATDLGYAF